MVSFVQLQTFQVFCLSLESNCGNKLTESSYDFWNVPTKAGRTTVTDNESKNGGSMHLIQCTGIGLDGKDCASWTSIRLTKRITRNLMDYPFLCSFSAALVFQDCKTSPPSYDAGITNLFCAGSNEQCSWRDKISTLGVEENNDEDVFERVVKVVNYIGVTISKQDISVCPRRPSRNTGTRLTILKSVWTGSNFRVMKHERNLKNSSKKTY